MLIQQAERYFLARGIMEPIVRNLVNSFQDAKPIAQLHLPVVPRVHEVVLVGTMQGAVHYDVTEVAYQATNELDRGQSGPLQHPAVLLKVTRREYNGERTR